MNSVSSFQRNNNNNDDNDDNDDDDDDDDDDVDKYICTALKLDNFQKRFKNSFYKNLHKNIK